MSKRFSEIEGMLKNILIDKSWLSKDIFLLKNKILDKFKKEKILLGATKQRKI
jgi:hypothetical protein